VGQLHEADISNTVAQQYIANPLLLDGYKFDLRIYALVSSVDPLKIYLYDEGLARLATRQYEAPCGGNLRTFNMHLTNFSINKHAAGFVSSDASASGAVSTRHMHSISQGRHLIWAGMQTSMQEPKQQSVVG
jgi:tubulin polyglutamylase TTLL6/13